MTEKYKIEKRAFEEKYLIRLTITPRGVSSPLAICKTEESANAVLKAVNAHDDLVDACETALANLKPVYSGDHIVIKKLTAALAKAKAVQ